MVRKSWHKGEAALLLASILFASLAIAAAQTSMPFLYAHGMLF
jgi:hypothetical protein